MAVIEQVVSPLPPGAARNFEVCTDIRGARAAGLNGGGWTRGGSFFSNFLGNDRGAYNGFGAGANFCNGGSYLGTSCDFYREIQHNMASYIPAMGFREAGVADATVAFKYRVEVFKCGMIFSYNGARAAAAPDFGFFLVESGNRTNGGNLATVANIPIIAVHIPLGDNAIHFYSKRGAGAGAQELATVAASGLDLRNNYTKVEFVLKSARNTRPASVTLLINDAIALQRTWVAGHKLPEPNGDQFTSQLAPCFRFGDAASTVSLADAWTIYGPDNPAT